MSTAPSQIPHYTLDDYVHWRGDWELWRGAAIAMSPSPFGRHQKVLIALATELRVAIRNRNCHAAVLGELDWIVSNDTVVRPDVMVVCGDGPEGHLRDAPELIAEVLSPSTRGNDLGFKSNLYAQRGVATYLIVDPETRRIELRRLDAMGRYVIIEIGEHLKLNLCDDCEIEISVTEVFN